jgi:hypothetical protein
MRNEIFSLPAAAMVSLSLSTSINSWSRLRFLNNKLLTCFSAVIRVSIYQGQNAIYIPSIGYMICLRPVLEITSLPAASASFVQSTYRNCQSIIDNRQLAAILRRLKMHI